MRDFSEWRLVWCAKLEGDVSIHVLEAHAVQATVKHLARVISNHRLNIYCYAIHVRSSGFRQGAQQWPKNDAQPEAYGGPCYRHRHQNQGQMDIIRKISSDFGSRAFASNVESIPFECRHFRFPNLPASAFRNAVR